MFIKKKKYDKSHNGVFKGWPLRIKNIQKQ